MKPMLYPLTFEPIFKERVWGGRNLERLYKKPLPAGKVIGESWEITDREEGVSVISNGPLAGKDLRWLMENHSAELLGSAASQDGRFPLLVKILDAQQKLSLQVHPPADVARELGGEPKTEMWLVTDAEDDADIFVGLKQGITPDAFRAKVTDGSVAECFQRIVIKPGDSMFLPSGRVHAIGAGSVIFEIQQNSDTTYRVFDWNRVGLDGKPRELHVEQAMRSIDFDDFEPQLTPAETRDKNGIRIRPLVECPQFDVDVTSFTKGAELAIETGRPTVLASLSGNTQIIHADDETNLSPGGFCLVPACVEGALLHSESNGEVLRAVAK